MLIRRGSAILAALGCAASLAVLPATAASADSVRDNQQWVLDMMNVPAAWQLTRGAGVIVAVIDSGVNPDVSDLAGSVRTGPDYTGISTRPSDPDWGVHGTWMASLIAGHGHGPGGGSGVIGVAPRSTILSIRVIPDRADPHYRRYEHEQEPDIQDSLAQGIDFAVQHGAKVISMSIGYSAPNGAVKQALAGAFSHGVVVVASAGNSGAPAGTNDTIQAPVSFPADYPGVISVGAVDMKGAVASFSSANVSVRAAAPGVAVPAQGRDGQYWLVSGTSPACALVAGVAALIKSKYPDLPPSLVATALTSTTTNRPPRGYDSEVGFGIVDAAAALAKAAKLAGDPPAPASLPAAARFGGGPAAVPAAPVRRRGSGPLVLFVLLVLTSLVMAGAGGTRLAVLRRNPQSPQDPHEPRNTHDRPDSPVTPGFSVTPDSQ
ncbi:MAG TPA: S8 family serine peptidase [Streptosporangiaceae bacterium]|nr:S8 family serine peptidase [Streptosporangiaceae bacterium]